MKILQERLDSTHNILSTRPRKIISILGLASMCSNCTNLSSAGLPNFGVTTVKIVSSFPLQGTELGNSQSMANSIRQAIDETQPQLCNGKVKIEYESLNDAGDFSNGNWDKTKETANANKAAADNAVVAYIGPYNSGAAKISIPILNKANLVMISPGNTYPGLTKPGKGEDKEPDVYYPTGKRNYARVIPADDIQGVVGARWAQELGVKRVYILDNRDIYGRGITNFFELHARRLSLEVLGHESVDLTATDYKGLMNKIRALNPDLIYFAGGVTGNLGQMVKDMRSRMPQDRVKFMVPDGLFEKSFIDTIGRDVEGTYITQAGIPYKKLTGAGKVWYENYKAKYKIEPELYGIYAYEATKIALDAISQVCKNDRTAILNAVMSTKERHGALGTWSFDRNGDTSLTLSSGNIVKNGKFEFVTVLGWNLD
jgi:branched-chain amino acid transport system substrate-binding protein